jgi:hypothetical protein
MRTTEELVAALSREAAPTEPAPHPFALSVRWMAAAAFYLALSLIYSGLRPDLLLKLHEPWFAAEISGLVAIFIATSLSAALLAFPDLHQMRRVALAPVFLLAVFMLALVFAWQGTGSATLLPIHTYECTFCLVLVGVLPAAWYFLGIRKLASTHYRWAGSIVLLSALSIGALWLRLSEPNDSIVHVFQWHYLPMVGFGIAGMWLGKLILKW